MSIAKDIRDNKIILELLRDGAELSGADIAKRLHMGAARLYPALQRLEHSRAVQSKWGDGPYPRRRLYRTT
jgi:DNA-binding PadR family transcriptional regulator